MSLIHLHEAALVHLAALQVENERLRRVVDEALRFHDWAHGANSALCTTVCRLALLTQREDEEPTP